jgi:hypothetical protein
VRFSSQPCFAGSAIALILSIKQGVIKPVNIDDSGLMLGSVVLRFIIRLYRHCKIRKLRINLYYLMGNLHILFS